MDQAVSKPGERLGQLRQDASTFGGSVAADMHLLAGRADSLCRQQPSSGKSDPPPPSARLSSRWLGSYTSPSSRQGRSRQAGIIHRLLSSILRRTGTTNLSHCQRSVRLSSKCAARPFRGRISDPFHRLPNRRVRSGSSPSAQEAPAENQVRNCLPFPTATRSVGIRRVGRFADGSASRRASLVKISR